MLLASCVIFVVIYADICILHNLPKGTSIAISLFPLAAMQAVVMLLLLGFLGLLPASLKRGSEASRNHLLQYAFFPIFMLIGSISVFADLATNPSPFTNLSSFQSAMDEKAERNKNRDAAICKCFCLWTTITVPKILNPAPNVSGGSLLFLLFSFETAFPQNAVPAAWKRL